MDQVEYIYMTDEIKRIFDQKIQTKSIVVKAKQIQAFMNKFKGLIFKGCKWEIHNEDQNLKSIALSPEIQEPFNEELQKFIIEHECTIQQKTVQRTYDDVTHLDIITKMQYNYNEVLSKLLPKEIEAPQGYETVGTIAHFNLKPEHDKYKYIIGEVLLDKTKGIKTVVNKKEKLDNEFRTPTLELMAGIHNYDAEVHEGGCVFHLNFEQVYWCTRLFSERDRILNLIKKLDNNKKNSVILDLFCGIGPFALRSAKQLGYTCIANDLNPQCYKFLCQNIETNRLKDKVYPLNMDAREVVKYYYGPASRLSDRGLPNVCFDHVYMNLPVLAMDFVDIFRGFLSLVSNKQQGLPYIHVYGFIKGETQEDLMNAVEQRIRAHLKGFRKENIIELEVIKNVTAKKKMVCVSFKLDEESAIIQKNELCVNNSSQKQQQQQEIEEIDDDQTKNRVKRVKM